jgi:hypothetical protein
MQITVAGNLSEDSYFRLERMPAIAAVFRVKNIEVNWLDINQIRAYVEEYGIFNAENHFIKKIRSSSIVMMHKELLYILTPRILDECNRLSILTVGFIGDEENDPNIAKDFISLFDIPVVYTLFGWHQFIHLNRNLYLLPVGADFSAANTLEDGHHEEIDVLFIGSPYEPRPSIINFLIKNGVKIQVYGSKNWGNYIKSDYYKGYVSNSDYSKTLSKAKIILGLMEIPRSKRAHINAKIFDASKVIKMSITTYYKPFEEFYGLVEGESLVTYKSKHDLLEKINYFLKNPVERRKISERQSNLLRGKYDYRTTYTALVDHVDVLLKEFSWKFKRKDIEINAVWEPLIWDVNVSYDPSLTSILTSCTAVEGCVVIHSVYDDKIIIKRLPIVDAASVFVRKDAKRPGIFFGFAISFNSYRTAYFPLNVYRGKSFPIQVVAVFNAMAYGLLIFYRKAIQKI